MEHSHPFFEHRIKRAAEQDACCDPNKKRRSEADHQGRGVPASMLLAIFDIGYIGLGGCIARCLGRKDALSLSQTCRRLFEETSEHISHSFRSVNPYHDTATGAPAFLRRITRVTIDTIDTRNRRGLGRMRTSRLQQHSRTQLTHYFDYRLAIQLLPRTTKHITVVARRIGCALSSSFLPPETESVTFSPGYQEYSGEGGYMWAKDDHLEVHELPPTVRSLDLGDHPVEAIKMRGPDRHGEFPGISWNLSDFLNDKEVFDVSHPNLEFLRVRLRSCLCDVLWVSAPALKKLWLQGGACDDPTFGLERCSYPSYIKELVLVCNENVIDLPGGLEELTVRGPHSIISLPDGLLRLDANVENIKCEIPKSVRDVTINTSSYSHIKDIVVLPHVRLSVTVDDRPADVKYPFVAGM